jgi:hypothetical protein
VELEDYEVRTVFNLYKMLQVKGGLLEDAKDTLEELERMVTTQK